ncbi:hypothetical protein Tco_0956479, partial [Tanacetum coccineum]
DDMINQDVKDSKSYKTYYEFDNGKATPKKTRKFKKVASPSRKLSPVLEEEPAEKPKRAKKPAKKSTTVRTAVVAIRDTPSKSVPKKKTPAKVNRGKGMDLLSDVVLLEAAQVKKTLKKSKLETHKLHASGSSDGVGSQPKVPDEQEDKTTGTDEGSDSDDDDDNDDDSDEVTKDDDDHEEEGKRDEEMIDAGRDESTQQTTYEQVKDDEHVTFTTVHNTQKTEVPFQSSSCTQTPPLLNIPVIVILETSTATGTTISLTIPPITHFQQQSAPTPTLAATTTTSVPALLDFSSLFGFDQRVSALEKELSQLKQADYSAQLLETIKFEKKAKDEWKRYIDLVEKSVKDTIKDERDREDKDNDEDPPARSDQGLKKQKTSKDAEPSRAEEPVSEIADTEMPLNQGEYLGNTDNQLNVKAASKDDWFKKPERPSTPDSDWNTTKSIGFRPPQTWISKIAKAGKPPLTFDELMSTPIDFSAYILHNLKFENLTQEHLVGPAFNLLKGTFEDKPLPLIENQGRQVVPAKYFINNNLEYLKGGSSSRKYKTSTTKTKAAKYDIIEGIEDMVPSLWCPVKLYKFKEGDFPRLNLHDIEDLLLLLAQKKLSNLEKDVIFDLNVALRMFTKRVVILKLVEDLQHGIKSYQKKLNITRPETFRSDIIKITPYTAYNNPQGIIYQDKFQRNRLMRFDELYKLCDDTLSSVRKVLHDIASSLEMDYLPKRR